MISPTNILGSITSQESHKTNKISFLKFQRVLEYIVWVRIRLSFLSCLKANLFLTISKLHSLVSNPFHHHHTSFRIFPPKHSKLAPFYVFALHILIEGSFIYINHHRVLRGEARIQFHNDNVSLLLFYFNLFNFLIVVRILNVLIG